MSSGRVSFDIRMPSNALGHLTNIDSVEMRRHEFQHEMCIVHVINQQNLGLRTGDPIQATCSGASGGSETFLGYVDHLRDSLKDDDAQRRTAVVCVGATWHMRQPRQRVWDKNGMMTVRRIVQEICTSYHLTANIVPIPNPPKAPLLPIDRLRTFNQVGESDWAFLCRLAKAYGYVVYPTQTVVNFVLRTAVLDQTYQSAPLLTYATRDSNAGTDISSFHPVVGDAVPNKLARVRQAISSAGQVMSALDSGAPTHTTRTLAPPAIFLHFDPQNAAATDSQDLAARVKGEADHRLWTYTAKAKVRGIANTRPMSALYLQNLDNQWDGYWVVIGVIHTFRQHFADDMALELGTNSLGTPLTNYQPGTVPIAVNAGAPKAQSQLRAVATVAPPSSPRGGPVNPLRWHGTPSSMTSPVPTGGISHRARTLLRLNA